MLSILLLVGVRARGVSKQTTRAIIMLARALFGTLPRHKHIDAARLVAGRLPFRAVITTSAAMRADFDGEASHFLNKKNDFFAERCLFVKLSTRLDVCSV